MRERGRDTQPLKLLDERDDGVVVDASSVVGRFAWEDHDIRAMRSKQTRVYVRLVGEIRRWFCHRTRV